MDENENNNIQNEHQVGIPVKIIMVGSINVGKTSLVTRYATGKFQEITKSSKNCSFISKTKRINGIKYEIKLWDTAGQEKYKSLTKIFIKDAKIAILVYSIDNEQSFKDLKDWLKIIKGTNSENIILGIAANKSDLRSENTLTDEKGKNFAKNVGAVWKLTSALSESNSIEELIDELFLKYLSTIPNLDSTGSLSITLSSEEPSTKSGCCGGSRKDNIRRSRQNQKKRSKNKK